MARKKPRADDEQPFFDAIRAAPDDDAPRLHYADWLTEQGDADRGEFIRLQCERARLGPTSLRGRPLLHREQELLKANREAWLRPLAALRIAAQQATFNRGLIEEVTITDFRLFPGRAEALFRAAPTLCGIEFNNDGNAVVGARIDAEALAGSPHLERLTRLSLYRCNAGSAGLRRLLPRRTSPSCAG